MLQFAADNPSPIEREVVYFAQPNADPTCPIKIGFTRDLRSRMYWLGQCILRDAHVLVKMVPLATIRGGFTVEQYVHDIFREFERDRREWFSPAPELLSLIDDLRKTAVAR